MAKKKTATKAPKKKAPTGRSRRSTKQAANDLKIQGRMATIADRYFTGRYRQSDIAKELGVSRATVIRDLQTLREEWKAERINDIDEAVAVELKRLERIEAENWDSWYQSKGVVEKSRSSRKICAGIETVAKQVESHNECGDPRYMNVILACVDKRCQLLGLYKPVKVDVEMTAQQRQDRLMRLAKRYNLMDSLN